MDSAVGASLDRRLARVEGQVRGLRKMLQEGQYCGDILNQLAAASAALNQVGVTLATEHIRTCILGHGTDSAHPKTSQMSQEDAMEELRTLLSKLGR